MTLHTFALHPFPNPNIPPIQITGRIARKANLLSIHYMLAGDLNSIAFPAPSAHPERKNELWTASCFEFFIALPGQPHYWEFNLSPSGDWNAFRMDSYRRVGFREEIAIQDLSFSVGSNMDCLSIDLSTDLSPIIYQGQTVQVSITSVIQTKSGHESYWALAHPKPQPDFHARESFILEL
jgi:hypothetical protein